MSEMGKGVLSGLNQTRTFFEEIARLLSTADSMMADKGWKALKAATVTSELSWVLWAPRQWMPHYLGRFYTSSEKPHLLACLGVAIGVIGPSEQNLLSEPLLIGSVYDYGTGNKVPDGWSIDYCYWHLWNPTRKDDGSICIAEPQKQWPEDKCQAQKLTSIAIPLIDVTDSESLKSQMVEPLCRLIDEM